MARVQGIRPKISSPSVEDPTWEQRGIAVLRALSDRWRMLPVLVALGLIWAFFWWQNPVFLSSRNLSFLSLQVVVTSIVGLGLVFVLLIGEIDLSVAGLSAVCAAIGAGLAVNGGVNPVLAVAVAIAVGAAYGGLQALVVTAFRVPSFIVTLGSSLILQGVLLQVLPSTSFISLADEPLGEIANTYLTSLLGYVFLYVGVAFYGALKLQSYAQQRRHRLRVSAVRTVVAPVALAGAAGTAVVFVLDQYRGVPVAVAVLIALFAIFSYVTTQTSFGTYLYAIGANREAARRAGIPVNRIRVSAFMLTGALVAIGGIVAASRVLSVAPESADPTILLEAIGAAVIGGTSLFGGRGSVWSALIGALVIGSVSNGLYLIDATTQVRLEVEGLILILAVVIDASIPRIGQGAGRRRRVMPGEGAQVSHPPQQEERA